MSILGRFLRRGLRFRPIACQRRTCPACLRRRPSCSTAPPCSSISTARWSSWPTRPTRSRVPRGAWRRCSSGCAARLDGRLAIVSGRSLADLERHLPLHGIAFSGSHGLELQLADGTRLPLSVPLGLDDVRERGRALRRRATTGLLVEEQAGRDRAPLPARARTRPSAPTRSWRRWPTERGFALQRGTMVAELRAHGATKGDALQGVHDGTGLRRRASCVRGRRSDRRACASRRPRRWAARASWSGPPRATRGALAAGRRSPAVAAGCEAAA